jgi:uncharacterized protein YrrD
VVLGLKPVSEVDPLLANILARQKTDQINALDSLILVKDPNAVLGMLICPNSILDNSNVLHAKHISRLNLGASLWLKQLLNAILVNEHRFL